MKKSHRKNKAKFRRIIRETVMKSENHAESMPLAYDTFILGEDERCHISTDCFKTQLNNNIMVVGGTGAGKTLGVMMPILLHMKNSNAVGVFTKWGMLTSVRRLLEKRGYKVHLLNLSKPEKSEYGFDPLVYCKTDEDVRDLAHAIVYSSPTGGSSKDPFWDTSAENLLEIALRTVKDHAVKGKATMATALQLLDRLVWVDRCDWDDWDDEEERTSYPAHHILEKCSKTDSFLRTSWKAYSDLSDQTGSSVTGCLQVPLRAVFPNSVRVCTTNPQQFNFWELTKPKNVLFVYVSPFNTANYRYVTLFYRQMFKALFDMAEEFADNMLPYPVHVLFDDFATSGKIPDFDKHISIFREKRISATMLIQSESQLSSIYGKREAQTIINNCDTYVFLGGRDNDTCTNVSKKVNVPFDEIMDMPLGGEFFIRRGQKAIRTNRYDIFNDPVYINAIKADALQELPPVPQTMTKSGEDLYSLFGIELPKKEEGMNGHGQEPYSKWQRRIK